MKPYVDFWKNTFNISGKVSRKDFWIACFIHFCVFYIVESIVALLFLPINIIYVFRIAVIIPGTTIALRRLNDAGITRWAILGALIPILGEIVLLIFFCLPTALEEQVKQ